MQVIITVPIQHGYRVCALTDHVFHDTVLCQDVLSGRSSLVSAPAIFWVLHMHGGPDVVKRSADKARFVQKGQCTNRKWPITDANIATAASQSATLLSMTVNIASEMHFNALRSLTQPCLTAYCIRCNTPMIQALYQALQISVSLGKRI